MGPLRDLRVDNVKYLCSDCHLFCVFLCVCCLVGGVRLSRLSNAEGEQSRLLVACVSLMLIIMLYRLFQSLDERSKALEPIRSHMEMQCETD